MLGKETPSEVGYKGASRGGSGPPPFTDAYAGQDYIDIIAYDISQVATERKSVYELARRWNPGVESGTKREEGVELTDDISLATERWQALKAWLGTRVPRSVDPSVALPAVLPRPHSTGFQIRKHGRGMSSGIVPTDGSTAERTSTI